MKRAFIPFAALLAALGCGGNETQQQQSTIVLPESSGVPCEQTSDCSEGQQCVGYGCDSEWFCVPINDQCNTDEVALCGCEGEAITAPSSNCSPGRHAYAGECAGGDPAETAEGPDEHDHDHGDDHEHEGVSLDGEICDESTPCPDGMMCTPAAQCGEASTCEPQRACTRDLVAYCGCDGQSFQASSTCPGQSFLHRGECQPKGDGNDGSVCHADSDCTEGLHCVPTGCGVPSTCVVHPQCDDTPTAFCGCDGRIFESPNSCPHHATQPMSECENEAPLVAPTPDAPADTTAPAAPAPAPTDGASNGTVPLN